MLSPAGPLASYGPQTMKHVRSISCETGELSLVQKKATIHVGTLERTNQSVTDQTGSSHNTMVGEYLNGMYVQVEQSSTEVAQREQ